MPQVTDKQYQMEGFIIEKMDCAYNRVTLRKLDAPFVVDGDEGFGKTSLSILCAYYLSHKTGRKFGLDNIFFDPKEFINFINSTKEQIIIWDEAALGGLASGWQSKVQQMLIQTLMTCRFRKHLIFFNCPKFYRLNSYFIIDRVVGMLHVYSENKLDAGTFTYYKQETLEKMLEYWHKYHKHPYKVFYKKQLRGKFKDAFELGIINEDEYNKKKEEATEKLLSQYSNDRFNEKLLKLQYGIYQIKEITQAKKAEYFNVGTDTVSNWGKIPQKYPELFIENN